jgi:large subunit ribosomal protein L21
MYAIVEIAGQQFKVSKDLKVYVHRLTNEEGTTVFRQSLFVRQWRNHNSAHIEGASVEAKVLQHLKGDKVIVFKRKEEKDTKREMVTQTFLLKL